MRPPVTVHRINVRQRQPAERVLGSGESVNAHRVRRLHILLAFHIRMHQRAMAGPVFRRCIGVHHLGQLTLHLQAGEQPVGQAGVRVGLGRVGEGEQTIDAAGGLAGGLGETLVKLAPLAACYVGHESVEYRPAAFVIIQSVVQEGTQEAPALGNPEGIGTFQFPLPPGEG